VKTNAQPRTKGLSKARMSPLKRAFAKAVIGIGLISCATLALPPTTHARPESQHDTLDMKRNAYERYKKSSGWEENFSYIHPTLASDSTEPVGLRLVSLHDVSSSIDDAEYDIQMEAIASAIESPDFADAVFRPGGPGSIALFFGDFNQAAEGRIGWVDIRKGQEWKFKSLADEIRHLPRNRRDSTNHVPGMILSMEAFDKSPWSAPRNVVDIMTDGTAYAPLAFTQAREQLATQYNATINALVTLDQSSDRIERWAWDNLATRPIHSSPDGSPLAAGFVVTVASQIEPDNEGQTLKFRKAMERAFRRKLILETSKLSPDEPVKSMLANAGDAYIIPSKFYAIDMRP
jgi:hypothetical protein